MPHTIVANTFVGVPKITGGIWLVPQTATLPTDAFTARPAGAIRLGGVSEDGYTYTSDRTIDKKKDWNGDKVRSIQQSKDDNFEITFIEFLNPNVLSVVYGAANVTVIPPTTAHGTQVATKSVADLLDHGAYIIDTFDGKVNRRRCIPDAQPDKIDPIAEKPGDWSVWKVTFDIFPDSQGVTSYTYTEAADKIVPSNWTATITGTPTGGTFTLTVGGQTTAGIVYNAAAAAVKTALELLSTVGTGNSTVTGSTGGPYSISLTNGGILTGSGAGLTGGTTPGVTIAAV